MADRFYSVTAFGADTMSAVVENAATQAGNPVEVRVTYDATNANKARVVRALEAILAAIVKDTFPPV